MQPEQPDVRTLARADGLQGSLEAQLVLAGLHDQGQTAAGRGGRGRHVITQLAPQQGGAAGKSPLPSVLLTHLLMFSADFLAARFCSAAWAWACCPLVGAAAAVLGAISAKFYLLRGQYCLQREQGNTTEIRIKFKGRDGQIQVSWCLVKQWDQGISAPSLLLALCIYACTIFSLA